MLAGDDPLAPPSGAIPVAIVYWGLVGDGAQAPRNEVKCAWKNPMEL